MNIWGLLFITVLLLWLFMEYLQYIKYRLIEIAKDYKELKKAQKELENEAITILKKAYEEKWVEEFESKLIELAGYAVMDLDNCSLYTLIKANIGKIGTKVKIKARKGKIVIERIEYCICECRSGHSAGTLLNGKDLIICNDCKLEVIF